LENLVIPTKEELAIEMPSAEKQAAFGKLSPSLGLELYLVFLSADELSGR